MHWPGFAGWGPRSAIVGPVLWRDGDVDLVAGRGGNVGVVAGWRYSRAGVPTAAMHRPGVVSRGPPIDLSFGPEFDLG